MGVGLGMGAEAVCVADGAPTSCVAVAVNLPDRLQEADSALRQKIRRKDNLFIRSGSS